MLRAAHPLPILCRAGILILLAAVSLPARPASAEETAASRWAEARKRHQDLIASGLESFRAEIVLRRSGDENLDNYKELAAFGYAWSAPEAETFDLEKTLPALRKPLREAFGRIWRDITGALWFDTVAKAENLRMEARDNFTLIAGDLAEHGTILASLTAANTLYEVEFLKYRIKETWTFRPGESGLQVESRELFAGDTLKARITYKVFREVNGFLLPTVIRLSSTQNVTEYGISYQTVNGEKAVVDEPTGDEVKELVKGFEEVWRDLDVFEKVERIPEYAETQHDLVSASIAKLGLRDRSLEVRAAAAEALGVMGRRNVVPALLNALKRNKGEPEVYLKVIRALGEIGDARAVPELARGWWSERTQERALALARAKIRALGNIRHLDSVDALIDAMYAAKDETIGKIAVDLLFALKKLTGQDFGGDRKAWKDWWKQNRATHRF